jgi:hypothetical protein
MFKVIISGLLLLPLLFYGRGISLRPANISKQEILFPGVTYQRNIYFTPRSYIVHIVMIDLTIPEIKPFVTPPHSISTISENPALTTSQFIQKFDLQLAINGSFFYPFHEHTPWDYYPRVGDPANVLGENIANKQRYGPKDREWNVLCFGKSNLAQILPRQQCPLGTIEGVAGMNILVLEEKSQINLNTEAYPRTAVATIVVQN